MIRHKNSIAEQIVLNASRAAEAGYSISGDSHMYVYNPKTDQVRVVVADLGQGIDKPEKTLIYQVLKLKNGLHLEISLGP